MVSNKIISSLKNTALFVFTISVMYSCGSGGESSYSLTKKDPEKKEDFSDKDTYSAESEADVMAWVKEKPAYIGGKKEMYNFIKNNLVIPEEAKKAKVSGMVFVRFIVEKDGKITNPKIIKGLGHGCEEAAKKVIMDMPDWKPGMHEGKPARVYHSLPIAFSNK
ncbi:energy transducer TonB [Lacihabitans sp. CCS-44]|uniref:energy transducer TonB n=1 Tax=Lacihabitans sp. CCS-44 TaxID=2487331 RepID=UPI0020CBF3DB|nr:energy transducer TonB [Lacihabitans sp. CCS-44]MCP9756795.1 energy transducer TonB [Lacihabitans sp. CCS-44]